MKMSFAIPRLYVLVMLGLVVSGFSARQALATATVFTQSYSATTAAGGTSMTSANAATVTVSRAALRDSVGNTGNNFSFPFSAGTGSNTASRSQFLVEQPQLGYTGVIDSLGWRLDATTASIGKYWLPSTTTVSSLSAMTAPFHFAWYRIFTITPGVARLFRRWPEPRGRT